MSDNKAKRGHPDRDLFNKKEPYEVNYAVKVLSTEFNGASDAVIRKALIDSANVPNFHENRQMIMTSARLKLRHRK